MRGEMGKRGNIRYERGREGMEMRVEQIVRKRGKNIVGKGKGERGKGEKVRGEERKGKRGKGQRKVQRRRRKRGEMIK